LAAGTEAAPRLEAPLAHLPKVSHPPIPALTGLRFFAAFFILVAHAFDWNAQFQDAQVNRYFSFLSMYGMPLFFVLSGFVIHYNYRDLFAQKKLLPALSEFAAARFSRLYPLYFICLMFAVFADNLLTNTGGVTQQTLSILGYFLTLTQSWWYVVYNGKELATQLFGLSWSISTEMYFYCLYAAIIFLLFAVWRRMGAVVTSLGFALLTAIGLLFVRSHIDQVLTFAQVFITGYIGPEASFNDSFFRWLFYFSPYIRVLEFLLGCSTAQAIMNLRGKAVSAAEHRWGALALAASLLLLGLAGAIYLNLVLSPLYAFVQFLALNFLCAPMFAVIIFCLARYDTAVTRLMAVPLLVGLGETSYSIYLVHTWTLRIFNHAPPPLTPIWAIDAAGRVVAGIGFTFVVSYATYRLIELPGRAWLRRVFRQWIDRAFYRHQRPPTRADLAVTSGPRLTGSRAVYTIAAVLLLPVIAVAGQATRSDLVMARLHRFWVGERPEIQVISATYGASCTGFPVPAPYANEVAPGNATNAVRETCDGRLDCDFEVTDVQLGDPANGCSKDFSVAYRCGGRPDTLSASVPGEALGQHALLQCSAARRTGDAASADRPTEK
jgi:peptidoglycan/LPS O-acetylase OafA/YrhL